MPAKWNLIFLIALLQFSSSCVHVKSVDSNSNVSRQGLNHSVETLSETFVACETGPAPQGYIVVQRMATGECGMNGNIPKPSVVYKRLGASTIEACYGWYQIDLSSINYAITKVTYNESRCGPKNWTGKNPSLYYSGIQLRVLGAAKMKVCVDAELIRKGRYKYPPAGYLSERIEVDGECGAIHRRSGIPTEHYPSGFIRKI